MALKIILILFCITICQQTVFTKSSNKSLNQFQLKNTITENSAEKLLHEHSENVNGAQRFITSLFPSLQLPNFATFMREAPPLSSNNAETVLSNKNKENSVLNEIVSPYYDESDDDDIYFEYNDEGYEKNSNFNNNDDEYVYADEEDEEQIQPQFLKRNVRSVPVIRVGIPSMPAVTVSSLSGIPSMSTGIGNLVQNTMSAFSGLADQSMRLLMNMSSSAGLMVGETTNSISNVLSAVSTFTSRLGSGITHFDETLTLEELKLVENTKNALATFLNDLASMSSGSVRAFTNNPEEAEKFIAAQNDLIDATRESFVQIFNETTRGIQQLERQMSENSRQDSSSSSSSLLTRLLRSASDSIRVMAELTRNLSRAIELSGRARDPQALRKEIQSGAEQIKRTTNRLTEYQRQNVRQILRRNKKQRDVTRRTQELRRRRTKQQRRKPIRRRRKQNKRRKNIVRKRRRNIRKKQNSNRNRRKIRKRKQKHKKQRRHRQRRKRKKILKRRKKINRRKNIKRRKNNKNRRRKTIPRRRIPNLRGRPVRFSLPIARNFSEPKELQSQELSKDLERIDEKENIQYEITVNNKENQADIEKEIQNDKNSTVKSEEHNKESEIKENVKVEKEEKQEKSEKSEKEYEEEKNIKRENNGISEKKKKKKNRDQKRKRFYNE